MADENKIDAELRERFGKGAARKLRAAGRVPAVVYGHGTEPQHLSLPAHEVGLILRKKNAVLELSVGGKAQLALVKDVQKDPVRQIIEHIDLVVVKKGEKVQVEVPVQLVGESFSGTIATLENAVLAVEAEATHIPSGIEVDIEGAEDGTQILAKDVVLPAGVTLVADPDQLIVIVAATKAAEAADAPEAEAAADAAEAEAE